nr:hypothetical protein [Lachnospiraceae bacterium]
MKGKDIMTSNYTFKALVDAYDNFLVPAVEILLGDGKSNIFQSGGASVGDIEITLSAREPSGVTFRVSNAFDVVSHKMDANTVNALKVGTVLEAALGYGSDLTTVFKGYITEYRTVYEEEPVIMVTAVDFRRLMMKNKRSRYKFQEKTYGEVFQEVVENYSGLYDTLHVDAVDTKTELLQNGTDYDFIRDVLCRFAKRDFFVVGADVYFQKPEKSKDAFLELAWGNGLVSFEKGVRYCNEKIMAYSCQSDKTGVTASAEVKTAGNTPLLVKNMHTEEWELEEGLDQTVVQNWVDQRAWEKKCKNEMAIGTVTGLPELVPGRYIKISGIDTADAGTYLIQEVRHSFDGDRFMTRFTVGAESDSILCDKTAGSWEPEGIQGVVRAVVKENWNEEQP